MRERAAADILVSATLSVGDAALRSAYVANLARAWPAGRLAQSLEELCRRAEQGDERARETLVAVVDALNAQGMAGIVETLRQQAAGESLLALERLIRHPAPARASFAGVFPTSRARSPTSPELPPAAEDPRSVSGVACGSHGRPLTLGERKWLARRPDRETARRLLSDPHPDVIRRCLRNPRLTEDDLLPLAARRPARPEVLAEIARSRWIHRPRIRLALVLNPQTPIEIAGRIAGLLLRHELTTVARSPAAPAGVRALCLQRLSLLPPLARHEGGVH